MPIATPLWSTFDLSAGATSAVVASTCWVGVGALLIVSTGLRRRAYTRRRGPRGS